MLHVFDDATDGSMPWGAMTVGMDSPPVTSTTFGGNEDNLVFDATHGLSQTLTWSNASQNLTINLDMRLEAVP